jgi:ribosomal protein S18 acetylase RimI-like enzyme
MDSWKGDSRMPANLATLALRPERPDDEAFLREVYAGTRQEELEASGMPVEMRAAFLDLQFKAQQQGYRNAFPNAEFLVILLGDKAIGRLVINRAEDAFLLVDIALLPAHRGRGIGTALVNNLLREAAAAKKPVRLSVIKGQRAFRLYRRLGFERTGEAGFRDQMEWRANRPVKTDY